MASPVHSFVTTSQRPVISRPLYSHVTGDLHIPVGKCAQHKLCGALYIRSPVSGLDTRWPVDCHGLVRDTPGRRGSLNVACTQRRQHRPASASARVDRAECHCARVTGCPRQECRSAGTQWPPWYIVPPGCTAHCTPWYIVPPDLYQGGHGGTSQAVSRAGRSHQTAVLGKSFLLASQSHQVQAMPC